MEETCRTVMEVDDFFNTWVIENFHLLKNNALTSAEFAGTNRQGRRLTWSYEHSNILQDCYRISVRSKDESIKQNVQVFFENLVGTVEGFIKSGILGSNLCFYIPKRHIDLKVSPDGSLKLRFKISFITPVLENRPGDRPALPPYLPKSTLTDDFANMLSNKKFTDLTITVGQQSFRAHKAILMDRSTVFAAMFRHDMQESQQNEITIEDVEPKVFEEILRFIYSDKVYMLPQMAHELLAAADKYDLARLKVMCEIQLFEGISAGSATKTLLFADLHHAKELKARTIDFLARNLGKVSDWEEFCRARPDLVAEILKKVAS